MHILIGKTATFVQILCLTGRHEKNNQIFFAALCYDIIHVMFAA